MKRIPAILLIVVMIFTLFSCRKSKDKKDEGFDEPKDGLSGGADIEEIFSNLKKKKRNFEYGEYVNGTELGEIISKPTDYSTEAGGTITPKPLSVYTISNEVIFSNADLTITVTGVHIHESGNVILTFLCDNKSAKEIKIFEDYVALNGYTWPSFDGNKWYTKVAAGETKYSEMWFKGEDIPKTNCTEINELEIHMYARFADSVPTDRIFQDIFVLYPTGLDASTFTYPEKVPVPGEVIIADNEGVKVVIEGTSEIEDSYRLNVYLENKTNRSLVVEFEDIHINGIDIKWGDGFDLRQKKRFLTAVWIGNNILKKYGITEVNEVEFNLFIFDLNDGKNVLCNGPCAYLP
ncbi:MAG: hypothetical protein GX928_03265 [Ruminococcaceae bacterium]|nr:hypothetical protein [Oscillospiraceae bacterium]